MDTKSKILFFIFFLACVVAIGFSYWRYMVALDYTLRIETACNPNVERCFVSRCIEQEDATCVPEYYKIILKKASVVERCDPNSTQCEPITCEGDSECQEIFCQEDLLDEGNLCASTSLYDI